MKYQKAINMIKDFEKCRLTAYKDSGGVYTIGWGSTGPGIIEGLEWTQEQADERFYTDFAKFLSGVRGLLKFPDLLAENQMCAVLSLVYNIGLKAFEDSTLRKKLNTYSPLFQNDDTTVFNDTQNLCADEFLRWNKDNGKVVAGLTNRRKAERELFLS